MLLLSRGDVSRGFHRLLAPPGLVPTRLKRLPPTNAAGGAGGMAGGMEKGDPAGDSGYHKPMPRAKPIPIMASGLVGSIGTTGLTATGSRAGSSSVASPSSNEEDLSAFMDWEEGPDAAEDDPPHPAPGVNGSVSSAAARGMGASSDTLGDVRVDMHGERFLDGPMTMLLRSGDDIAHRTTTTSLAEEVRHAQQLMARLGQADLAPVPSSPETRGASTTTDGTTSRDVFCSRTINMRSINVVGYDLDYTLIHYNVENWEGRAYYYGLLTLKDQGCDTEGLVFDPDLVIRGLIIDTELGNLVKADRFGYVKRAMHGTRMLTQQEVWAAYGRELVDLRVDSRWVFLNTLFSVSEAVMYAQVVDKLDVALATGRLNSLPRDMEASYPGVYKVVSKALFRAHVEGKLKAEIMRDPGRFVEEDPELPRALLDQRIAGKRLVLITNSDFEYTSQMMTYAYDRFLPPGMKWRDLFDLVIVSARKPDFFSGSLPLYEVVTEDGLMRPCFRVTTGGLYCGGSARMLEKALGVEGLEVMYVGDHIYTDVSASKVNLRWRTCLIIRELESEVEAMQAGARHHIGLEDLMSQKDCISNVFNQLRLSLQRERSRRPAPSSPGGARPRATVAESEAEAALKTALARLLLVLEGLDSRIEPMLRADGAGFNRRWGYLSRAGLNDKSHLTKQIEKYADVYTSRVSNLARYTPYYYFRSPRQLLSHDPVDFMRSEYTDLCMPLEDAEALAGGVPEI